MASIRVCRDKINKQSLGYGYVSRPKWLKRHQIDDLRCTGKHHEHHEPTLRTLRTLRMLRMPSVPCVHALTIWGKCRENARNMHVSITPFGILLAYAKMQPDATCSQKTLLPLQFLHVLIVSVSCQTADLQGEFSQCKWCRDGSWHTELYQHSRPLLPLDVECLNCNSLELEWAVHWTPKGFTWTGDLIPSAT